MPGLLFYDGGRRQGEFYATRGQGAISLTRLHTGWRSGWSHIIAGNFSTSQSSDLLFYDADVGLGQFYSIDSRGRIREMRSHGLRRGWTHIICGNFSASGFDDLLFYDAETRLGEFYTTDGQGGINLLQKHDRLRRGWTHIIPGNFSASGFDDLLFYDADTGLGEFYTTDGQGGINELRSDPNWRRGWTHVVVGNFSSKSSFAEILFYDAATGLGQFYTTDGQGGVKLLRQHTGWRRGWDAIVRGVFSPPGGFADLLFYDSKTGLGEFYATDGQGGIDLLRRHVGWRTSWRHILTGFGNLESNCIRVHFKSIVPISSTISDYIENQLTAARELFSTRGINVVRLTTEDLSADMGQAHLATVDVDRCLLNQQPTADQADLFANTNNVGNGEIVVYITQTITGVDRFGNPMLFLGCAAHPSGQPGAVLVSASTASWLLAHELGHVLGLIHVCEFNILGFTPCSTPPVFAETDNLMYPNVGWTNVPPDLSRSEENSMHNSALVRPC
jgi:hypothetical protein